ncbi:MULTISPECIES: M4 family metallopeptidase [unclassified Streptomyces]|uniref:M4 family metallopeptidase n=1 Tax=unclassified Streptomyces TaxID=2593676 RepID=UPI002E28F2DE|nr:M4 family metallopeptidase [Streptomyces sp. NBC_01439]
MFSRSYAARLSLVVLRAVAPVAASSFLLLWALLEAAQAAGGRVGALAALPGASVQAAGVTLGAALGAPVEWSLAGGAGGQVHLASYVERWPWLLVGALLPVAVLTLLGRRAAAWADRLSISRHVAAASSASAFAALAGGLWVLLARSASEGLVRVWTPPLAATVVLLAWALPVALTAALTRRSAAPAGLPAGTRAARVRTARRRRAVVAGTLFASLLPLPAAVAAPGDPLPAGRPTGDDWKTRSDRSDRALGRLRGENPKSKVVSTRDTKRGTPTSVVLDAPVSGSAPQWLDRNAGLLGANRPSAALRAIRTEPQPGVSAATASRHQWYQQTVDGVPVRDARVGVHLDPSGSRVRMLSNGFRPDLTVASTRPGVTAKTAEAQARAALPGATATAAPTLMLYPGEPVKGRSVPADLVWEVRLANSSGSIANSYFVDAVGGTGILHVQSNIHDALNRTVYDMAGSKTMPAQPMMTESNPDYQGVEDARRAWFAMGHTYTYYKERFNRDSYDGQGAPLKIIVRNGNINKNAYWSPDRKEMLFAEDMVDLSVSAHELTHAVDSASANLVYQYQSGALNESFSDIFGKSVDRWQGGNNWEIGSSEIATGVIRDMANPGKFGQPAHMRDFEVKCGDAGGVHHNSGIPNRAYVTAYEKLGVKAEYIFYEALTNYLFPTATFADAVNATQAAAWDRYGKESPEAAAVIEAWNSVGVTSETDDPRGANCVCSAGSSLRTAKLSADGPQAAQIRAALYLAQDLLPEASPAVRYYVDLYNQDNGLIQPLMAEHPALNGEFAMVLQTLTPLLLDAANVDGAPQATVTAEHIAAVDRLMDNVIVADQGRPGGGALTHSIATQWRASDYRSIGGLSADDAMAAMDASVKDRL